jgi:hypothetical protein
VPSPTLLCIGLAHPRDPLGEMAPAWERVFPPLPSTGSKRIASIGRDSVVMKHERRRDWRRVRRSCCFVRPCARDCKRKTSFARERVRT